MEFSNIERVDISKIPVRSNTNPIRVRILSLDVGQAVTISGIERSQLGNITSYLKRKERRIFRVMATAKPFTYRVIRLK